MMRLPLKSQRGFTLIEMIVVIVITGIIAGMVAIFLRAPVQGYVDSERRAEMTDIADTAMRRLTRDLRTAVPNSVRVPTPAGSKYIEYLPTKAGGRYRLDGTSGASGCGVAGDDLFFDLVTTDTCFEVVGTGVALVRGAADDTSDQIVIGSTQSDGNPPYNKTAIGVRRPFTGVTGTKTAITITGTVFPTSAWYLVGYRFEIVPGNEQAVTYACTEGLNNGDGTGTLTRYWGYGFNVAQVAPPLGGNNAVLADHVESCNFVYDTTNARNSLLAVTLQITRGGESVRLYQEIHVNNIP